jgi:hypothetical protein
MTDPVNTAPAAPAAPAPAAAAPAAPVNAATALMGDPAAAAGAAPAPAADPAADPAKPAEPAPVALTMPGKDATPEEWSAFYAQIGRPETPEGYELPVPEGDDGDFAKQMAPILHKNGLTAEQAKGLAADWNAMMAAQLAELEAADVAHATAMNVKNTAEAAELKNEWGQAHDANMHFAKLAVQQFMPADKAGDVIAAIESKLGYKATIQFLHGIGKGLGEHDAAGMGANNSAPPKTLAERLYPGLT